MIFYGKSSMLFPVKKLETTCYPCF